MATDADFSAIVKLHNGVHTAGAARQAAGAALNAASAGFQVADTLRAERRDITKRQLEGARVALKEWYRRIEQVSAAAPFDNEWSKGRKLVEKIYLVVAGIEGEAGYRPQTSNLQILGQSLAEAPQVFTHAVGKVAGTVAKEAGAVVGNAAGGILSGLGISGTVTLVLVALAALVVLKKGSILGLLARAA